MERAEISHLHQLNVQVTEQIFAAENSGDAAAWAAVSATEEAIADLPESAPVEVFFAQRGAIEAAIKSGNLVRAEQLSEKYKTPGFSQEP